MLRIYLQGALEPIEIKTSMQATGMNMSAAVNAGVHFWGGHKADGSGTVLVAINKVLYLEEDVEEVEE